MAWTHGRKWSDELIETEIRKVMEALNIDRMPTRKEIESVAKDSSLTNKISKGIGFYGWAARMGLQIKDSETTFGKSYESQAMIDILQNTGLDSEKMSQNFAYDILVDGSIRVDVKVSNRYYYNGQNYFHTFNLERKHPVCDIMVCYCLDENKQVEKILVIPSSKLHTCQLSVGVKSQYDAYNNAWDVFHKYSEFYSMVS